jgi:predicted DNA-binding protein YlxM (UPF0122 family)
MTTQAITSALLKIPEIETAVLWFIEEYSDANILPWDKHFKDLYIDFNICFPANFDKADQITFIGLTIINDYSLVSGDYSRTYKLCHNNIVLDLLEEKEISNYVVTNLGKLVFNLYEATQREELDKYDTWLETCVKNWNTNTIVLQEQVLNLSIDFSVKEISEMLNINSSLVHKIIQDAITRIDEHLFLNLFKFLSKVNHLKQEYPELKGKTNYLDMLIEEISNGGQNINEPQDLLPEYNICRTSSN